MKTRFEQLVKRVSDNSSISFEDIEKAYQLPKRAYHNLEHIAACIKEFDSVVNLLDKPDSIELTIWFHDIVYDPKAYDNEEQSARFLLRYFPDEAFVAELIRLTDHKKTEYSGDSAFMIDIDLSILGTDEATFTLYESAIREEYSFVPDEAFRQGRAKVLERFLNRERIYQTEFFSRKYEAIARENLKRSMSILR